TLDRRALELEAQARHTTPGDLLAGIRGAAVFDEEARAYYEANKKRTTQTFDQVQPQITQYLATQHNATATRDFYYDLRARHGIKLTLAPYRVQVAATGPARGQAQAPVTIIEFADFQCPYCQQAEEVLRTVMANHGDAVRLVFRNLPLSNVHPNATIAAIAGVCADRQGKFWDMHDAMFTDQKAL